MAIQQTLVGLEQRFAGRADVASRRISADDTLDRDDRPWLQLGAAVPYRAYAYLKSSSGEQRIPNELIETLIQAEIDAELPDNVQLSREVAVGAMYRDDLPIPSPVYANQYVVISFEGIVDLERPFLPADPT